MRMNRQLVRIALKQTIQAISVRMNAHTTAFRVESPLMATATILANIRTPR
ncbi:hypothetical protein QMZ30_08730 [Pantoea sp. EA-12]|uniref:hypothetical protein n=1 Tax=Pantoea sp. EA-12 TaxID=3043303 RepID=UPI0024B49AB8|nr:hypothetical protein [Pantoea sp. EA-12]MDI9220983.1 hypothetical protein [Pantoea sp. EA-12]